MKTPPDPSYNIKTQNIYNLRRKKPNNLNGFDPIFLISPMMSESPSNINLKRVFAFQ